MKKIVILVLLASQISFFSPNRAAAMTILIQENMFENSGQWYWWTLNILLFPLVLLDGDNSTTPSTLKETFSFIEDKDVINHLIYEIYETAKNTPTEDLDGKSIKRIRLQESKVRQILAPADLDEDQIQLVIQEFQN